jgi:very-short-patch-repair endonuclease
MESYLYLFLVVIIIVALALLLKLFAARRSGGVSTDNRAATPEYRYMRREHIMTPSEEQLFKRLEAVGGDRYYVFPQIHLSSLLNHKVKGQNWKGALSAIQRKSVDFVLVDKTTLETKYAVELDDSTHDKPERQERDGKVEHYLAGVDIPLVRLRDIGTMTDYDIEDAFRTAHARSEQTIS